MAKHWRPSPESFLFDVNRNLSATDLTVISKQNKSKHSSRRTFAHKDLDIQNENPLNPFTSKVFEVQQNLVSTDGFVEKLRHEKALISHYSTRPDNKIIQNAVSTLCSDDYKEEDITAHDNSKLSYSMIIRKKSAKAKAALRKTNNSFQSTRKSNLQNLDNNFEVYPKDSSSLMKAIIQRKKYSTVHYTDTSHHHLSPNRKSKNLSRSKSMSAFTKLLPNPLTSFHPQRQHMNIARNISDPNIKEYPLTSYYKIISSQGGNDNSRNNNLQWFTRSAPKIETQPLHERRLYSITNLTTSNTVAIRKDNDSNNDCIPFGNPLICRPNL